MDVVLISRQAPTFFRSLALRVFSRISCHTASAFLCEISSSSGLSLKTRLYLFLMFRLDEVQSTIVNAFRAELTFVGVVVDSMSDDLSVPFRMVATAQSIRFLLALQSKADNLVCVVPRRSRQIILYSLLHDQS